MIHLTLPWRVRVGLRTGRHARARSMASNGGGRGAARQVAFQNEAQGRTARRRVSPEPRRQDGSNPRGTLSKRHTEVSAAPSAASARPEVPAPLPAWTLLARPLG